jgi:hypothetical protein
MHSTDFKPSTLLTPRPRRSHVPDTAARVRTTGYPSGRSHSSTAIVPANREGNIPLSPQECSAPASADWVCGPGAQGLQSVQIEAFTYVSPLETAALESLGFGDMQGATRFGLHARRRDAAMPDRQG